nr:reverse transcriptase domain-containing protein [Tanacetum cinerariifolium]
MLRACPHHGISELTQIDTFYNGLNEQDQDSLNATAGGNLLSKTTREALKIIKNKSKVRYSRSKSNVSRVNTNSRDSSSKTDDRIDKLADQISNLVEIVNKQVITLATAKAVEKTCVICGGAHAYYDCIATDSNQPSVCAAPGSFFQNQASTSGTLPSNTVPNPKGEMKAVTTRGGLAYEGPSIHTNSPLEKVVEQDTEEITDKEHSNCQRSIAQIQPLVIPISILEPSVPKTQPKPNIPYPSRLNDQKLREKATNQMENFFQIFHDLHFDISFADALLLMPKFASTIKSLLTNKDKLFELAKVPLNENCSAMLLKKLPEKLGDPGKFLIPCNFSRIDVCHALADLGASINMPLSIWKKLSLPKLTPTRMTLELKDRSITRPKGVAEDVFVKVGKFHFPTDFVVVYFEDDPRVSLILGRSFLRTGRALIDVHGVEITLRVNDESVTFNLNQTMRYSSTYDDNSVNRVDVIDIACEEFVQDVLDFQYNSKSSNPTLVSNPSFSEETKSDLCKEPIVKSSSPTLTAFGESDLFWKKLKIYLTMNQFQWELKTLSMIRKGIFYGFLGYFQIPIDPEGQEKKTFTCPYGTFSYRRMPFGLCNAPGTFQRCMIAIFHDIIEKTMEVFMDDFSVFGDSFSSCLSNLEKMLKRCEDTNLVLNWEKCHFMCKEGIVLEHKISKAGIEVDRAKVDVIAKLPHPTVVKGVRSFLGHAGFYRRFIQDFSKIARPMTHLLEKETPFVFSKECIDAFNTFKKKLTEAPILVVPDWNLPFELMCDASDFAIGAVLGQLYAFEKFRPYLVLSKSIVYTDHSALKYLLSKQDAKPRLLWWVLLLQEFDITIRDLKGSKNLAADHLSRLENLDKDVLENKDINENFPLETLGSLSSGSTPWAIISDRGTHFCNEQFARVMTKYGVIHRLATALPPSNEWSSGSFQSRIEMHFREDGWGKSCLMLVYGKSCHLPIKLEHKAYWALKHFNFDLKTTSDHRKLQLNELNELRDQTYENSLIYKEKTKKLHDSKIKNRIFNVFPYGTVELSQPNGPNFKVNGHRVKHYFGGDIPSKVVPVLHTIPMDK